MRRATCLLPCLLLLASGACGGSGGTPAADAAAGPQPFNFSGPFYVVGESEARTALFGSGVADAEGGYAGTLTTNDLGVVAAPPLLYEAGYGTLPDGSLVWASATTGEAGFGGMTTDGRVAAWWWSRGVGSGGGLSLLLRREGLFDEASLDVTDAVLADLADGRSTSDFLLAFPIEENGDDEIDRVVLDQDFTASPSLGPRTRLVLTYE